MTQVCELATHHFYKMNATELTHLWILNDIGMYTDCKSIAVSSSNEWEAADRIKNYLIECIDEYRPYKGHAHGFVCDILSYFPHEIDYKELVELAKAMRANEA